MIDIINLRYIILLFIFLINSCNTINIGKNKLLNNTKINPPIAKIKPHKLSKFNIDRIDNYYWLKNKNNTEVIDYLKAENKYTQEIMKPTEALQKKLYKEIISRIEQNDESYHLLDNGYFYFNRKKKGKQYKVYLRKKDDINSKEEVLFDLNAMSKNHKSFIFDDFFISDNNKLASYLFNTTGSYAEFTLKIKDLINNKDLDFNEKGVTSFAWNNDNKTFYYTKIDSTLRPYAVYKKTLGNDKAKLIFKENDPRFRVYVYKEKTNNYIIISSVSYTSSERYLLSANEINEAPKLFLKRAENVEYSIAPYKNSFIIQYKDKKNFNSKILKTNIKSYDKKNWKEIVSHNPNVMINHFSLQDNYLIIEQNHKGLTEIKIINLENNKENYISFPEVAYSVNLIENPNFKSQKIYYEYSSLNRPSTLYGYDLNKKSSEILKETKLPCGFSPDDYIVERIFAKSNNKADIPIMLVYKKGLKKDSNNPVLLYSYGSYGINTEAYFRGSMYSLIDRGFIFAIAQIRGGSELGEKWYENGKFLKKKNTFIDFIASANKLIEDKYTSPKKLNIMGGSAGGLLMGAVINMSPNLFNSVIALVPFVDVLTTMLDDTLPLTTGEYEEWGNPNIKQYFKYMLSYSPYDNVKSQNYPNILVTAGLNDSQVLYHEPAKWVAKLRATKNSNNLLLLHTNMKSGHGGSTGIYDKYKDLTFELAFILFINGIYK